MMWCRFDGWYLLYDIIFKMLRDFFLNKIL